MANAAQPSNIQAADVQELSPAEMAELLRLQGEAMAELKANNDTLSAKVKELSASAPKSVSTAANGTFKAGGRECRVVHGVKLRREGALVTFNPADILREKEIREYLVSTQSTAVQAV